LEVRNFRTVSRFKELMKREDDQELWDLLGSAPQPAISPFFSRNVVRRVRQESGWSETVSQWFSARRLIPVSSFAVAVLAAALAIHRPSNITISQDNPPELLAAIDPQDYEVVVDLDDLLASEDDNVWTENESLSL
jgi:hypothetical protein